MSIPRLWAVTDRRLLGAADWRAWCAGLAALGVRALQVREKDVDDRVLFELATAARGAFPRPGRLVLNRRFDVALAADADGVHLPAAGLAIEPVRAAAPAGFLVGRSTHSLAEIAAARDAGADYVFFGPILATPSKSGRGIPHGISSLTRAAAEGVPVIAIGGLDETNARAALDAGAHGVAAIRAFADLARAAALVATLNRTGTPP
ncbi:MAG: thiamine phosphate synthase [Myxococcota bacterium]